MDSAAMRLRKAIIEKKMALQLLRDAEAQSNLTYSHTNPTPNRILAFMQEKYSLAYREVSEAKKNFGTLFKETKEVQLEICEANLKEALEKKSEAERSIMNKTRALEKTQLRMAYLENELTIERKKMLTYIEKIEADDKIIKDAVLDINVSDAMVIALA
jgi:pyruvate formate-lyase activating enzyme-like uncharacterized protein